MGSSLTSRLTQTGQHVHSTYFFNDQIAAEKSFLDLGSDISNWQIPGQTDAAFLCAAVTSLEQCRTQLDKSRKINVVNMLALAERLSQTGAALFFPSSNLVFDGLVPFRKANDAVSPCCEYGRQNDQSKGLSQSRSESILVQIQNQVLIPEAGTLLDVGCGNGNLLRSFSKLYPSWKLSGLEFDDQNRSCIEKINNVSAFYSCDLSAIAEQFDMISMIHCLEHIINPVDFLLKVKDNLGPQGLLLIEIPSYTFNPFDLVIADHCTHLDMNNLKKLIECSGFEIVFASTEIVPKEMTLLARKNSESKTLLPISETALANSHRGLVAAIAWLKKIISSASQIATYDELGVFGTSIAGTWLYNEMPDNVSFFVDEDPDRINRSFLGRPVYHPDNIPEKSVVFIPLPPVFASGIAERLKIYGNRFVLPPLNPAHVREL